MDSLQKKLENHTLPKGISEERGLFAKLKKIIAAAAASAVLTSSIACSNIQYTLCGQPINNIFVASKPVRQETKKGIVYSIHPVKKTELLPAALGILAIGAGLLFYTHQHQKSPGREYRTPSEYGGSESGGPGLK